MDETAQLFEIINKYRAQKGLAPLNLDPRLSESAAQRCRDLSAKGDLSSEPGRTAFCSYVRDKTNGCYQRIGELVGLGDDLNKLIQNILKNSGEDKFIFSPKYTHVGIGMYNHRDRVSFYALHFGGN